MMNSMKLFHHACTALLMGFSNGLGGTTQRTHAALCWVGAPRGLLETTQYPGLQSNLRDATLLGLAPKHDDVQLTVFALVHLKDVRSAGNGFTATTFDRGEVASAIQGVVANELHPQLQLGGLRFTTDSTCSSAEAQAQLPCCQNSTAQVNGELSQMWMNECFNMVTNFEKGSRKGTPFDWVVRSRTDFVCSQPLPSLALLPPTHVHATIKEFGSMWDTLFLIPRLLLERFREAAMSTTSKALHSENKSNRQQATDLDDFCSPAKGRNADPSLALFRDLVDGFAVPLKRLPLSCALVRPFPGEPFEKAECGYRLKAHSACALNAWQNPNHEQCLHLSPAAMKRSEPVGRALCEDIFALVHRSQAASGDKNSHTSNGGGLKPLGFLLDGPAGVASFMQPSFADDDDDEADEATTKKKKNDDDVDGDGDTDDDFGDDARPVSYTIIAQPRSGGTTHVDLVARLFGCTGLNEMYHGTANQTASNIRAALLREEQTGKGFMVDPTVAQRAAEAVEKVAAKLALKTGGAAPDPTELVAAVTARLSKESYSRKWGNGKCNVFKLKPDHIGSGMLDNIKASLPLGSFENYVFLVARMNVTAQVLSFAMMKATGASGRTRPSEVFLDEHRINLAIREICEQRRFMLRHSYDAIFLTEDFGSGRVVELPNGRRLVYEKASESDSGTSSYAPQTIVWVRNKYEHADRTSKAELRFEDFRKRSCSILDDQEDYMWKRMNAWVSSGTGGGLIT